MGESSRRNSLKVLLATGLSRLLSFGIGMPGLAAVSGLRGLIDAHPIQNPDRHQRAYRVDATILLLNVPLLKRADAGTGCVSVETGRRGDQSLVAIQFAAGSDPGRAHGLNRFGVIREAAVLDGARLMRSACAGFMTSSPESTFDSAKQALQPGSGETPCSMVISDSSELTTRSWKVRFALPGAAQWQQSSDILSRAEQTHVSGNPEAEHTQGPLATFLYAVRFAVRQPTEVTRTPFFYNNESHTLETRREANRLEGTIYGDHGNKKSTFTLWFDPNEESGLPTRIGFRARSFLHLTLEALEAVPSHHPQSGSQVKPLPTLAWLLKEETA